jgi:hypothetical protein
MSTKTSPDFRTNKARRNPAGIVSFRAADANGGIDSSVPCIRLPMEARVATLKFEISAGPGNIGKFEVGAEA